MTVQFILGRAGSGKTHHCLESIRAHLRQNSVDGPQLLFLVPEQASLQMEQSLLEVAEQQGTSASSRISTLTPAPLPGRERGLELTAYHRAQVVSFQRLAHLVLQDANLPAPQAVSEPARIMVLRHIVQRLRPKLQYFRRADRLGSLLEHLGHTISELIQESVSPEALTSPQRVTSDPAPLPRGEGNRETAGSSPSAAADPPKAADSRQAAKLHDLQLIYAEYLAYLGTERLDPSQHLELARRHLGRCPWLSGAMLWVDGFASFSEQELLMLLDLARLCRETQITALLDPAMANGGDSRPASVPLFRRTFETLQRLRKRFDESGIAEIDPLMLAPPELPRFSSGPALLRLERAVFQPESRPAASATFGAQEAIERRNTGGSRRAGTSGTQCSEAGPARYGIRIAELPSLRVEVDYAVAQVCRWVQQAKQPLRYRDTAIIVRDLDVYHDLLRNALASRNIPFFIDKRRPLTHHPLVELIRAAVRIATENASSDSMRQLLKTDLLPLSPGEVDAMENYLLATGIAGFAAWRETWRRRSRKVLQDREEFAESTEPAEFWLDGVRAKLIDRLAPWIDFSTARLARTGPQWASAIRDFLTALDIGRILARWTRTAEEMGDIEAADEHRQAWEAVFSLLDDLAFAFEQTSLTVDELSEVLEAALATVTLALVPPTVDQVLVGAIERSRHPDIKSAVLVGFNDGIFPKRPAEDSILNDDDRALLRARGLPLAAPTRERVTDESLLAYIALTRASEELVITYSTTDAAGKPQRPSPFVAELQAAVPKLQVDRIADPVQTRSSWDVLATSDLRRRLAEEFRTRPPAAADALPARGLWNSLYAGTRQTLIEDRATRIALAALDPPRETRLNPATVRRCFPDPLQTSVSRLETFAACPFKYLAKYVLRLCERDEADLRPLDVGSIHHAVLADFTKRLMVRRSAVAEIDENQIEDELRESCRAIAGRLTHSTVSARDAYLMARVAQRLARVIRSQSRRQQGQNLKPRASELPFGFEEHGLPALKIKTPAGKTVELRGFIDHVDLFELSDEMLGVVVDYKSRGNKLDMSKVFHGLSLQLLAYLLAMEAGGTSLGGRPIRPAGAVYVGIHPTYKSVDHPSLLNERDAELSGIQRPRGILLGEALDHLDPSHDWSTRFQAYRKRDGSFGYLQSTDVVPVKSEFQSLLAHTRQKLGQLADAMLDGEIAVNPCRIGKFSPCSWCEMAAVCRFEMGLSDARFLEPLKRLEVIRRISETGS